LEESLDLLQRPARGCVSFIHNGEPRIEPIHLRYDDGRYLIGIEPGSVVPDVSAEVVLVVDEGVLFFELRAVYIRGMARAVPSPPRQGMCWLEVEPTRVSSWNYGRMRRTRDAE
jgi:hypothetical protein